MAGLTEQGLTIKRQNEVITDLKERAVTIFQDLVPAGSFVDTGDSTTIGRLIGLISVSLSDLWEVSQGVYHAFDPNSSTGIALDNLVMYGGLTRNPPSPTSALVLVWGDEGTQIPAITSEVRALDNTLYTVTVPVTLSRDLCNGFQVRMPAVTVGSVYSFTISSGNGSNTVSKTAVSGDTPQTVLQNLYDQVALLPEFNSYIQDGSLVVETIEILDYIGVSVVNLLLTKIRDRTQVENNELGSKEQEARTINAIATPIIGWDSVINPNPADPGKPIESDEDLRIRFRNSKYVRAQNISDSLYSHLLALNGLISAGIFENETDVYDPVYDLPPHSFRVVAQGGSPADIANTIWKNKPLGISSIGNTTEQITDSQGYIRDIRFDRPVPTRVYITMELSLTDSDLWPANGADQIRANLVDYFQESFSIGDPVIYSRLYTPINLVAGHQVNSLTIGTSPNPTGTNNIAVPYNGIATLDTSDIIIIVVP